MSTRTTRVVFAVALALYVAIIVGFVLVMAYYSRPGVTA